jgi:hypothetical protein
MTDSAKSTANMTTENTLLIDVSDVMWHVGEPTEAPIPALLGGDYYKDPQSKPVKVPGRIKKEKIGSVKYDVVEKVPRPRQGTTNGAVNSASTTAITFDSTTMFRANMFIKNVTQENGEIAFIVSVAANGTDAVIRRNIGATTFTIADNDVWEAYGTGFAEGTAKASVIGHLGDYRQRRAQIFKTAFGVTNTAKEVNQRLKGYKPLDEEMNTAIVDMNKDIDASFFWNPFADSTTDANSATVNITRGIVGEIKNHSDNDGENITWIDCTGIKDNENKFMGEIAEEVFFAGNSKKTAFCDSRAKSILNAFKRQHIQSQQADKTYGFDIDTLSTGHGELEFCLDGGFNKMLPDTLKGFAVVLDLPYLSYGFIQNRDIKIDDAEIQLPGTDSTEKQLFGEIACMLKNLPSHVVLYNMDK